MSVYPPRIVTFFLVLLLAGLASACGGFVPPIPVAGNPVESKAGAAHQEVFDEMVSMIVDAPDGAQSTPGQPMDIFGEMVSMIVDAPGGAHFTAGQPMDIFGEMVSMIVDAPGSDQSVASEIANAMGAAPIAISRDATILGWPVNAGDPMVVLRKGTNAWTCYSDWPASPGNDPECNDPIAEGWLSALFAGKEAPPPISSLGIAYMLGGGSDPSNTDPMAVEPEEDKGWVTSPAHLMLLAPGGFDAGMFGTDPDSGKPWIMWDGTPYEHLMVPVADIAR